MLQRIYDILYQFKEYAILIFLIIISLILMALNDNSQVKKLRTVSTVVFGVVQEKLSFIPSYFGLKAENELLRRINVELSDEVQRLRDAKLENFKLKQLLELKENSPYKIIAGKIVNKNLTHLRNTITLNIGSSDSIMPQMPVISERGLVGLIVAVSSNYSVANILTNIDFKASAKVQRSRVDGIVAWDGKTLNLKNVPKTRDVKIGDLVVTSEYSGLFPPNIRIGLITDVKDSPNTLFKNITITPDVDFIKLEEVFVILRTPDKERQELEQKIASQRIK